MDSWSDGVSGDEAVLEHFRIASSDLRIGEVIGYGSSGVVHKADWLGCEVAVKAIVHHNFGGSFKQELEILMQLPHPHVVQLLGFCRTGDQLWIVMEYLGTPLLNLLVERSFDVYQAVEIMTKIALGMKFLHSRDIVHGGLTPTIIMMNVRSGDVKIAGFSFAEYAEPTAVSPIHPTFTLMLGDQSTKFGFTKMRDVYSFGMICYAVITGCNPRALPENLIRGKIAHAVVSSGCTRPENLVELILKCMDVKSEHRPPFSAICDALAVIRGTLDEAVQKHSTMSEIPDALRWTTFKDSDDSTCLEIEAILQVLPSHLSIDPGDVEWRRLIGEGSYSKVYEVNWLGCLFAAKRFKSLSAALKDEVEFLTKLQHPHIARLMGLSIDSSNVGGWIMMERMESDLEKLIHSRAPFNAPEARELCLKIALGLNFLHSRNVVHRDIKPANVLVHDRRGCFDVKITDFGMSHKIGNPTNVANYAGTGLWRAPEILRAKRGEPLTEDQLKKTDVYSFGMTCYGIVTGNALHEHLTVREVIAKRRPELPASLDSDLRELISKCWHDDPELRPDFPAICRALVSPQQVMPRSRRGLFVKFRSRKWLQCLPLGMKDNKLDS